MDRLDSIGSLKSQLLAWRQAGHTVGFVPTMGALHEGHLSLVRAAKNHATKVVVSIFVNPTQFGPNEDFATYPRTIESDCALLGQAHADAVFLPTAADIYPEGYQTYVVNDKLSGILCGASRPGHFRGVLTVVLKLFNLVQPDTAVFGLKDYQQFVMIRRMAEDLCLGLKLVGGETVREADGLAMSSRNRRLSPDARANAPQIYRALRQCREAFQAGLRHKDDLLALFQERILIKDGIKLDYCELRSHKDLSPYLEGGTPDPVLCCAAYVGGVRLIDNLRLGGP